jgi:hypothetical protein
MHQSTPSGDLRFWFTIMTPAYNRAQFLPRLYDSLCRQSCQDFEWLLINNGSTDDTDAVAQALAARAPFAMRYRCWPENRGLVAAMNYGVAEARGYFFGELDDDDWLLPEALERCLHHWRAIPSDQRSTFSGVVGLCADPNGRLVSSRLPSAVLDSDAIEIRTKYRSKGDHFGVHQTEVLRAFSFPAELGDSVPLALVWNRIASQYKHRYFNEVIAVKDYQRSGGTARATELRVRSPHGPLLYYREFIALPRPIPLRDRLRNYGNLIRFSLHAKVPLGQQVRSSPSIGLWSLALLLGVGLFLRDRWITAATGNESLRRRGDYPGFLELDRVMGYLSERGVSVRRLARRNGVRGKFVIIT